MRIPRTLKSDTSGEPIIWWSRHKNRVWLHTPRNTFGMEWWKRREFGIRFTFSDGAVGTAEFKVTAFLFVLAFHFYIQSARWLRVLPGVRWRSGMHGDGERELGASIAIDDDGDVHIWLCPWSYPGGGGKRDVVHVDLADVFLGRRKYSEEKEVTCHTWIDMPEGAYEATIRLYDAVWRRPRWPRELRVTRADVSIPGGIPIPGKSENSWDQNDDAFYEFTVLASTISEAEQRVRDNVMDWRRRHGGEGWVPDAGWPAHCMKGDEHGRQ